MRYEDALLQHRRVYAVVRGWGVSSDGNGGITRPEVGGQVFALQRAYRRAGLLTTFPAIPGSSAIFLTKRMESRLLQIEIRSTIFRVTRF